MSGGTVGGLVGGAVISLFMLFVSLIQGRDMWAGLKAAGAPLLGDGALQPGFEGGPVALGILCHFAVSIAWGLLFALACYGVTKGATVVAGAFWGVVVWVSMAYVLAPTFGLSGLVSGAPVGVAIVEHVLFGLGIAAGFLPYQRTRIWVSVW